MTEIQVSDDMKLKMMHFYGFYDNLRIVEKVQVKQNKINKINYVSYIVLF